MINEKLEVIKWSEFQKGIAPLWKTKPSTIPIFNNPYNIIQYPQHMWHTNIVLFPVCYKVDNKPVAYSCVYNISDDLIRTRGIFVLEALSVFAQVISFKTTGKRIFRMAPIHHHFEQKGWSESTIVIRFWIISIILALVGLASLKLR